MLFFQLALVLLMVSSLRLVFDQEDQGALVAFVGSMGGLAAAGLFLKASLPPVAKMAAAVAPAVIIWHAAPDHTVGEIGMSLLMVYPLVFAYVLGLYRFWHVAFVSLVMPVVIGLTMGLPMIQVITYSLLAVTLAWLGFAEERSAEETEIIH